MNKPKIYFPSLNGLRFIAAFLVIIEHIEQIKSFSGMENYLEAIPFINGIGKLGVVLFFVLSGFLITYLLIAEEHSFQTISIKKFYIRRMLRIWPLYFLIIILAFFLLPHISLFTLPGFGKDVVYQDLLLKMFLYVIFFPNLVFSLSMSHPYTSPTWSIGTEEQFYLVWPVILKRIKKNRIILMFLIIFFYLFIANLLSSPYSDFLPHRDAIKEFWKSFNIDCMAIGGIYAICLFQKNKALKFLLNQYLFYSSIVIVMLLIINDVYIPYFHWELYSVLYGIIILNFAANQNIRISLENKVLNYLGTISYGLYLYHSIAIGLIIGICRSINLTSNWLIYPLSIITTVIMAGLSYKYFETFFLSIKGRFSKIISGNETKQEGAKA